jgi:hypothetical protein
MRQLETSVHIDATPDEVWRVLTDFDRYGEWNPFITSIEGPVEVGARLSVSLTPPGGRTIRMKPTVRVVQPGRRLRWLGHLGVPGIFDGEHEFVVEPAEPPDERGALFTQRETFRGAMVPFVGRILERTRRGFEAMNRALKERVEAVAP